MENRTDGKTLFSVIVNSLFNMQLNKDCNLSDNDISYIANRLIVDLKKANFHTVEKFLFVEDRSVDLDEINTLAFTNPEIKVLVVRQGGRIPQLVDAKKGE